MGERRGVGVRSYNTTVFFSVFQNSYEQDEFVSILFYILKRPSIYFERIKVAI